MAKTDKLSKRKTREKELATEVLCNKTLESKYGDTVDDLSEPTLGEKLASLNLEKNIEAPDNDNAGVSPIAKPPSADSVHVLLKQALRADDRALLMNCLFRQDAKVIENSLSLLNPSDVVKLLQSLVPIMRLRGAVVVRTIPWLRSLLLLHTGIIMSQESSLATLNSIYQLIDSRVSTFSHTLQLSSCLDLLYAETVDDEREEDLVTPVIYEDEDDSDEEGDGNSMEVESVEGGEAEAYAYSDISDDEENREV